MPDRNAIMFTLRPMHLNDYDTVIGLMQTTPGVSLRDADSRDATERYLARNPGLSFVALVDDVIVGCIMSGHDGRRGYLQHLLVAPGHRRQGIAKALIEQCLAALAALGIVKSHIDVLMTNTPAQAYWEKAGWQRRHDIARYSLIRSENPNA
jgi:ribosomal protein S18 acetylase RimI-like enzyme